jgi:hypothetical protein
MIGPFPCTGKEIYCRGRTTPIWRPGRTTVPGYPPGQSRGEIHGQCGERAHPASASFTRAPPTFPDIGSGERDGRAQALDGGHQGEGLFL